jgi:VWFA-related protein
VAALVAARSGAAQSPPRQTPDLLLPVTTEVVRIDVVVTEKGGRPRPGLTQDDFVVLEDGQPQKIAQFEAFTSARSPAPLPGKAKVPPPPAAEDDEASPARAIPPRRSVVLAVDDVHIETSNLLRIRKALNRFLEHELEPEDQVAIVTTSGTRGIYQEFTDDRHALQRSVDRLSVQERTILQTGAPYLTEYQAQEIERGDQEALRVAVEEIQQEGLFQDEESAGNQAKARAREVLAESIHNSRLTLETLDSVVRSLSEVQGRKVLVLVSDGFLAGISVTGLGAFDIRRITDAGTRAGVVIYALDTRGLVATAPGRTASSRMPALSNTFSARDILTRQGDIATRDAMHALAADSGGFLVQNTNDLTTGLRRILTDTETYYLIAYESTNAKRDGAFRKVEVRLPGARDLRVRTRKGYFAPDERRAHPGRLAEPPPDAPDSARAADERRASEINRALTSLAPQSGIPVRLTADFVSLDGSGPQLVVSSHIDLRGVPFTRSGDHHVATVDAAATVFDESGAVVESLAPERAAMDLTDSSYERALKKGLDYQRAAPIKRGRYRVRFAAREDGEGKLGSASQWVQVPDLADGKLSLSSLFLLEKADLSGEAAPAAADGDVSLRGAQTLRRFKPGQTLYVQLFAYNPGRSTTGATSLVTQAEIWRGGVLLASSAPDTMEQGDRSAPPVPHTRSIKLEPFQPGDYEVRIVVTDQIASDMKSRRAGFTIE